jgi:hypothetical protein
MAEKATGRQRLFAKAIGVFGVDRMDRDSVSVAIDAAKSRRSGPPNAEQLKTAISWGVDLSRAKTAGAATDRLWRAALSRVYVYSVLRRLCEAEWQFHDECPIPQSWINKTAVELCDDWKHAKTVEQMDNSMSGTKGDPWVRFGKRQAETEAFKFVESAVQRDSILAQVANAPAKPIRQQVQETAKGDGCLTMLFSLLVLAPCAIAWIASITIY